MLLFGNGTTIGKKEKNRSMVAKGQRGRERVTQKGHKGTFRVMERF